MSDPARICDGSGRTSPSDSVRSKRTSATGADNAWKHVPKQLPIPAQPLCGHFGHGFAALWHGIAPEAAAVERSEWKLAVIAMDGASGTASIAPSIATMPKKTNDCWKMRFFKDQYIHALPIHYL